jgi:hypothetical protein
VPKEITGYLFSEVERRRCASMLRLLFEAHTVQNLSLKGNSGDGQMSFVGVGLGESTVPSRVRADCCAGSGGGGGGGGG